MLQGDCKQVYAILLLHTDTGPLSEFSDGCFPVVVCVWLCQGAKEHSSIYQDYLEHMVHAGRHVIRCEKPPRDSQHHVAEQCMQSGLGCMLHA